MEAHDKDQQAISFETTKIRGGKEMAFTCPIDWDTLRISPQSLDKPASKETIKKAGGKNKPDVTQDDGGADLPWHT
jgi:hypothetical protein